MSLFGGVISLQGVTFLIFSVFCIAAVGYSLGRIKIKGIDLGTAGVFVISLVYGILFSDTLSGTVVQNLSDGTVVDISSNALKIIENLGLVFFVTAVGFIAGPNFFKNFKKNYKSYILLGIIIIASGALACVMLFHRQGKRA